MHQTKECTKKGMTHIKRHQTEECTKKLHQTEEYTRECQKNGPGRGMYQTKNVTDRGFHQTIKGHQTRPVHLQQICCLCAVRYNVEILFTFD